MNSQRPIFRERAVAHYVHRRQQDVLPHIMRPAIFLGLWVVVALLLIALILVVPGFYQLIGG